MVYKKIVGLCAEKGISLYALERLLELGNGTIKGWEKTNPRVDLLKKVADYFGVTLDELIKEGDE